MRCTAIREGNRLLGNDGRLPACAILLDRRGTEVAAALKRGLAPDYVRRTGAVTCAWKLSIIAGCVRRSARPRLKLRAGKCVTHFL